MRLADDTMLATIPMTLIEARNSRIVGWRSYLRFALISIVAVSSRAK